MYASIFDIVSPQNSYFEILPPYVLVLGGGLLEVIRSCGWSPHE